VSTNTIDSEKATAPELGVPQAKGKRPPAKKTKPTKKARGSKKSANKPNADRANKKTEVIALLNRAKGATLAEIRAVTQWQAHTVRGFVSILGSSRSSIASASRRSPQHWCCLDHTELVIGIECPRSWKRLEITCCAGGLS
jgi:hypothetical protein